MRRELAADGSDEKRQEDARADRVTEIERHRHGVAAGLAERRRRDLDDPEDQGDLGDFARSRVGTGHRAHRRLFGQR